jgi:hypothetical protein
VSCLLPCSNPAHKGHRIYVGGPQDGHIQAMLYAHSTDFPLIKEGIKRQGRRVRYERDMDGGTDVVYRFTGYSLDS